MKLDIVSIKYSALNNQRERQWVLCQCVDSEMHAESFPLLFPVTSVSIKLYCMDCVPFLLCRPCFTVTDFWRLLGLPAGFSACQWSEYLMSTRFRRTVYGVTLGCVCVYRPIPLIFVLRWPCAVDRTWKSNYWLTNQPLVCSCFSNDIEYYYVAYVIICLYVSVIFSCCWNGIR